jgi:hypothetical protein
MKMPFGVSEGCARRLREWGRNIRQAFIDKLLTQRV